MHNRQHASAMPMTIRSEMIDSKKYNTNYQSTSLNSMHVLTLTNHSKVHLPVLIFQCLITSTQWFTGTLNRSSCVGTCSLFTIHEI